MIEVANRLSNLFWRGVTRFYYRPQFGAIGDRTLVRKPLLIRHPKYIFIGARCGIRDGVRLELVVAGGRTPRLEIGDDVSIEQSVQISCGNRVLIGNRVTIACRCMLADVSHPYQNVAADSSIGSLIEDVPGFIEIGDECFIGAGAVILPNVTLGRHCVVGANAVVTKSMPPYSVCVGVPAKVIRRYDAAAKRWIDDV